MTKRELKELAGVKTDTALAGWFGDALGERITQQSVSKWGGDDDPIPRGRFWQIQALLATGRLKSAA